MDSVALWLIYDDESGLMTVLALGTDLEIEEVPSSGCQPETTKTYKGQKREKGQDESFNRPFREAMPTGWIIGDL